MCVCWLIVLIVRACVYFFLLFISFLWVVARLSEVFQWRLGSPWSHSHCPCLGTLHSTILFWFPFTSFLFLFSPTTMSYSGSDEDGSTTTLHKSMLANEVLSMGEESKSSFDSTISVSLFEEDFFSRTWWRGWRSPLVSTSLPMMSLATVLMSSWMMLMWNGGLFSTLGMMIRFLLRGKKNANKKIVKKKKEEAKIEKAT